MPNRRALLALAATAALTASPAAADPDAGLDALLARGRIRAQDTQLAPFAAEPLRETARIAALVRERLGI